MSRPKGRIKPFLKELEKYWKKNPDLRLAQILGNVGAIYQSEEDFILQQLSLLDEEVSPMLWGTYGKDGKQKLKYKPIKELTTEHIMAILETQALSEKTRRVFMEELEFRIL